MVKGQMESKDDVDVFRSLSRSWNNIDVTNKIDQ